jgi:hypothetical protein
VRVGRASHFSNQTENPKGEEMKIRMTAILAILSLAAWLPAMSQQTPTPQPAAPTAKSACACCDQTGAGKDMACCSKDKDNKSAMNCCAGKDAKQCSAKNGKGCCGKGDKSCCGKDAMACNAKDGKGCCDSNSTCCHTA